MVVVGEVRDFLPWGVRSKLKRGEGGKVSDLGAADLGVFVGELG